MADQSPITELLKYVVVGSGVARTSLSLPTYIPDPGMRLFVGWEWVEKPAYMGRWLDIETVITFPCLHRCHRPLLAT